MYFDTGVGNKRRLIPVGPIADALGPAVVKALPSFHAFTGADCTSAFIGKGKRRPFKILTQSSSFTDAFHQLGESLENVSSEMLCNLQKYVCCMHGRPKMEDVNKVRSVMFQSRYSKDLNGSNIGIDLSLLPPCASSLHLHILRANYQCYVWKNAHKPYSDIPSPTQHGWVTDDAGKLVVQWTSGAILPQSIVDLVDDESRTAQDCDDDDIVEDLNTVCLLLIYS